MRCFTYKDKKYTVDALGYLLDPSQWDENFAEGMAPEVRIENGLTEAHWKVIYFIRNTFDKMNLCPLVYVACKQNDIGLGDLRKLFPTGYLRGACRLAGVTYREGYFQKNWIEEHIVHHKRMYDKKVYETDVYGFLVNCDDWDENFAVHKAYELKMPEYLTKKHWDLIYFMRNYYKKHGEIPTVYETCEKNRLELDELEKLFPDGYHRGAVKVAGLRDKS